MSHSAAYFRIVVGVGADRAPAAGTPEGQWWAEMIEAGHLELTEGHHRWFYRITDAGARWLAEYYPAVRDEA